MNRITGYAAAWCLALAMAACGGTSPPSTPTDRVLLQGDPEAPAIQATTTFAPVAAQRADIDNGVVLTKIDVRIAPDATVGQVNAALALVGGSIASMRAGSPALSVVIPRASNVAALRQTAQTLAAAPGIAFAHIGRTATAKVLPPSPAGDPESRDLLMHLLPARFPAAWNAARLATQNCEQRKVPVLLIDHLPPEPSQQAQRYAQELPGFTVISGDEQVDDILHGFALAAVLGARFDGANPTGANPYTQCLDLSAINVAYLTVIEEHQRLLMNLPSAGKFILNRSLGYRDECPDDGCTPDNVRDQFHLPVEMAVEAVDWIRETAPRWDDFLITTSAGNSRNESAASIYPGLAVARVDSDVNLAADPGLLARPVPFAFAKDPDLWQPDTTQYPDYPSLAATDDEMERLARYAELSLGSATPAPNVLVVGSVTPGSTARPLVASDFSDTGPDLHAVGEDVFALFSTFNGTSVAAPQVAGLASYLWLLSPELRSRPASVTRQAILANTQRSDSGIDIVDAYAAVLSLDRTDAPTPVSAPVRLAVLDLVANGRFDEADLEEFVAVYFDPLTGDPREPEVRNYRPWDLNGDGFGGGAARRASFDLNRVGSTQFGATNYATVTQQIEGKDIAFDERAVTDVQILCYYAHSALYTGSTSERARLLASRCAPPKGNLPATGQSQCYGVLPIDGQVDYTVPCGGTGQDGELRAGAPWPEPRFSVNGECVTDNLSGLMWWLPAGTVNPSTGNIEGPDGFPLSRAGWQQSLDYVKTLSACGFADWRMPNSRELDSVFNAAWFPPLNKLPHQPEFYWLNGQIGNHWQVGRRTWTSTTRWFSSRFSRDPVILALPGATLVPVRTATLDAPAPVPRTGQDQCYSSVDVDVAVIDCAGTGQDGELRAGTPWPNPRFVVGAGEQSECITDALTGLTWMRSPPTTLMTWLEALDLANQLQLCGHADWRLPNSTEAMSLRHDGQLDQASWLGSQGFVGLVNGYWTSTTAPSRDYYDRATVAYVGFAFAYKASPGPTSGFVYGLQHAWPVRGGVSASSSRSARP
jgi:Protein of unknown function (DUF1566)/Subtilase family